jgi:hypothetical protein
MKRININNENEKGDNEIEQPLDPLKEEAIDKDLVYLPECSRILWTSSWLFLGTSVYTVYNQHYDLLIVPGGLFLTSINYWKEPRFNSWQRNVDVYYIYFSFLYQFIRCYNSEYILHFLLGLAFCSFLYKISSLTYNRNMIMLSALLHSCLHITANFSIAGLNSGYIEPFCDNKFTQIIC